MRTGPALGITMHMRAFEVGDRHADLWGKLSIVSRRVEGPEDRTVAFHPDFGLSVIDHHGLENRVLWWTARPIREPDTDEWAEMDALLAELDQSS
ncbi:UNVERIFIED_ORG: hypothetical protein M2438_001352 [Methylobacterium sp. SuP10 SLI 274]|uniref:hypothetical protein n=1 Tax=Methylorubrum extorquens TaxID=408 RepID=UPI0020A1E35F|nr:hypothetical protein [Methylorubrum extorquens]MDF9862563.1 hypothetical protein [Methylorubrum pseudosasae]MDH6636177.1 hypothetical protein [Methylobacterium sp. SuP10 SLI 274]MDH6665350.1 hypothetical protein [Methylorubrum zatmanii]MCP1557277.1 hypothetical protein [Methylorubrum extorquens]MDF9790858.1 hypothetical protein [Methylorubrum extorquens]